MGEETGEVRAAGREPGFRRFNDRLLVSACALVLMLVAAVWGLTWYSTDKAAGAAHQRLDSSDELQRKHAERILKLELLQDQTQRDLRSIDDKQSKMEGKIESVQRAVNDVLIELRKPK